MNIRFPEISALSDSERISQIHDYLFTLAKELNFALRDIESGNAVLTLNGTMAKENNEEKEQKSKNAEEIFATIKPLIIKNADIVDVYSEEINKKLSGYYVASSEFGKYKAETDANFKVTSQSINQYYENIQLIESNFAPGTDKAIVQTTNATITTGLVGEDDKGTPLYGMEVSTITNGKTFASARFLSTGVIIYDESGNEALIITDNTITAKNINVSTSFTVGGMRITAVGKVITGKYVG